MRTPIFVPGWRPITRQIPGYISAHPVPTVRVDWALVVATVCSLLSALNNLVLYRPAVSMGLFVLFVVLLLIVLRRTRRECPVDDAVSEDANASCSLIMMTNGQHACTISFA